MTVEKWSGNANYPNQGFVSLEICQSNTSICQIIDHVLVDTGSYGLRLMSASVHLALPQSTINGAPLAECTHFVSGYMWGTVAAADVTLGTQKATGVPIQVIDGTYAQIPNSCSSSGGTAMNTASALGANGILGIGSFQQDCPGCATQARTGHYYTCASTSCVPTAVPLNAQVINPVAMLASNDNGVILELPTVSSSGQPSAIGRLTFGIDTSTNNAITSETVFDLDTFGYLTTTYGGNVYSRSYIDSGSNGIFFTDNTITRCTGSSGFYCPSSSLSKPAVISSGANAQTISFVVDNPTTIPTSYAVLPNLAGSGSDFAWGLPFFYGRKVFVSISGKSATGKTSPVIAF